MKDLSSEEKQKAAEAAKMIETAEAAQAVDAVQAVQRLEEHCCQCGEQLHPADPRGTDGQHYCFSCAVHLRCVCSDELSSD